MGWFFKKYGKKSSHWSKKDTSVTFKITGYS